MRLTKDELVRRLDALGEELSALTPTVAQVTEITRGVDDVDTDDWAVINYLSEEQLPKVVEAVANLRRDVVSDL